MMSDEEYRDVLSLLASRFFRPSAVKADFLREQIERFTSLSLLVEASKSNLDNSEIVHALADTLSKTFTCKVIDVMDESGVLDAIDEMPETVFSELRRSVIPSEDIQLLRRAGIVEPEAEITIVIQYAKKLKYKDKLTQRVHEADNALHKAAKLLKNDARNDYERDNELPTKHKRKIVTAVGRILAGTITGAGNILLGMGIIVAPNPATGYAIIGSSALSVMNICQGIDELLND